MSHDSLNKFQRGARESALYWGHKHTPPNNISMGNAARIASRRLVRLYVLLQAGGIAGAGSPHRRKGNRLKYTLVHAVRLWQHSKVKHHHWWDALAADHRNYSEAQEHRERKLRHQARLREAAGQEEEDSVSDDWGPVVLPPTRHQVKVQFTSVGGQLPSSVELPQVITVSPDEATAASTAAAATAAGDQGSSNMVWLQDAFACEPPRQALALSKAAGMAATPGHGNGHGHGSPPSANSGTRSNRVPRKWVYCTVPANLPPGRYKIAVTLNGARVPPTAQKHLPTFTVFEQPVFDSMAPTSGHMCGGARVTLTVRDLRLPDGYPLDVLVRFTHIYNVRYTVVVVVL